MREGVGWENVGVRQSVGVRESVDVFEGVCVLEGVEWEGVRGRGVGASMRMWENSYLASVTTGNSPVVIWPGNTRAVIWPL